MRRQEVAATWIIPAERHKSKSEFLLPLSKAALDALAAIPTVGIRGWIFTTTGEGPIAGFSKYNASLMTTCCRGCESISVRQDNCRAGQRTI